MASGRIVCVRGRVHAQRRTLVQLAPEVAALRVIGVTIGPFNVRLAHHVTQLEARGDDVSAAIARPSLDLRV